jgi:hypothetical protein
MVPYSQTIGPSPFCTFHRKGWVGPAGRGAIGHAGALAQPASTASASSSFTAPG